MKVTAKFCIVLRERLCRLTLDPFDVSARRDDEIQSAAIEHIRNLFSDSSVFTCSPRAYYYVAMPLRYTAQPTTAPMYEDCECDVYCLKASDKSSVGLKLGQLVAEIKAVFHLSDVTEDMVTPWQNPPSQESEWSSYDEDKRFEDCATVAGVCTLVLLKLPSYMYMYLHLCMSFQVYAVSFPTHVHVMYFACTCINVHCHGTCTCTCTYMHIHDMIHDHYVMLQAS